MRILFAYNYYQYPIDIREVVRGLMGRLNSAGIEISEFCLTLNPPGPCLQWKELDLLWKKKDKGLLELYEKLEEKLESYDVLLNFNGINLHPEFVRTLPVFTVYSCFDDPESSDVLSRPVAPAYDLCLAGNIAEVDTYKKWGVKNAYFWPLGFRSTDYDPLLNEEKILSGEREYDLSLICERESIWRKERIEKYYQAFPNGVYYGRGWPNGFLPEEKKVSIYQQTKIGPNFHNSTGPINFRTYILPANGVMQICDNKAYLGKIFKLGEEVIGFNTVKEAIDLARYYLEHDDERRKIASKGWKRAISDYNEVAVFQKLIDCINKHKS
jgi:spore maturation protein CgeB